MRSVIKDMTHISLVLGISCSGFLPFVDPSLHAEDRGAITEGLSTYVVKRGDTVSKILFKLGIGTPSSPHRIYGKNGWMQRLHDANPNVTLSKIYPGQKILMPAIASEAIAKAEAGSDGEQCIPSQGGARFEKYTIQQGDSISKLLYKRGVGHPDSKDHLFGEQGWVLRTQKFNTGVNNWQSLHVGQQIVLLYPNQADANEDCLPQEELAQKELQDSEEMYDEEEDDSGDFSLAARPLLKSNEEVAKRPEEASIEQITALPKEMQQHVSVDAIAAKLDIETVADMDDEVAKKIPPQAVERRARQVSISEGGTEEMQKIFADLKRTPAAFVGARAIFSLGTNHTLASKVRAYSLFSEIREGTFDGLRVIYEKSLKYKAGVSKRQHEFMNYQRGFVAWAIRMPLKFGSGEFFVTPRFGAMKLGAGILDPNGNQVTDLLRLKADQTNLAGLAFDAEFAAYFYQFRLHAGHDATVSKSGFKTTSTRIGFDALVKGEEVSIFGVNLNPGYTASLGYENLKVEEENNKAKLDLKIPTVGLGISLYID